MSCTGSKAGNGQVPPGGCLSSFSPDAERSALAITVRDAEPTRLGIVDCGLMRGASPVDVAVSAIVNRQSAIDMARTPAMAEFTGPDGGKTAHYMLRWLSTRGEAGPWSETASATVGA